jgi:hypothetical protein
MRCDGIREVMGMTDPTLPGPMPDVEVRENLLDLGRPELAFVMQRYCSHTPSLQTAALNPPSALIVTRRPGQELPIREELENAAWFVKTCSGPGKRDCPLLRGERCELRESVDATVVFVDPQEAMSLPRLRCAADSSSPGVVALEGSFDPPCYSGSVATVGSARGPHQIVTTIAELLERD